MTTLRVRQVLDAMNRRSLTKFMPPYTLPEELKGQFPSALLSVSSCSEIGIIAEQLVLMPQTHGDITVQDVINAYRSNVDSTVIQKIQKSKTTQNFVDKINATRAKLFEIIGQPDIQLNQELAGTNIVGHPDGMTDQYIIEVKTTSKLDKDHAYFVQQLATYMALKRKHSNIFMPKVHAGLLVLPLQQTVVQIDPWDNWAKYLEIMEQKAKTFVLTTPVMNPENILKANFLIQCHSIGRHVNREKTLLQTVKDMTPGVPYQIFLGNNQSSHLSLNPDDVQVTGEWTRAHNTQLYIHAPYIINLAKRTEDDWQIKYLVKTLDYGAKIGAKGVVIHVGKSTDQDVSECRQIMAEQVRQILDAPEVSSECPLLLETPAGQGTEMFKVREDFIQAILEQSNPKFKACVDTCHVFALGYSPLEYVKAVEDAGILHLIHYNDSKEACGSCKDRHAFLGTGHISIDEMAEIANFCTLLELPMVIE